MPELNIRPEFADHYTEWLRKTVYELRSNFRPMTAAESNVFLVCMVNEMAGEAVPDQVSGAFVYKVLELRLKSLGATASPWAMALLYSLCRGPGAAVMMAHVFAYRARTQKLETLKVSDVAQLFPDGYPTEEALSTSWDAQKGYVLGLEKVDNMLDLIPSA